MDKLDPSRQLEGPPQKNDLFEKENNLSRKVGAAFSRAREATYGAAKSLGTEAYILVPRSYRSTTNKELYTVLSGFHQEQVREMDQQGSLHDFDVVEQLMKTVNKGRGDANALRNLLLNMCVMLEEFQPKEASLVFNGLLSQVKQHESFKTEDGAFVPEKIRLPEMYSVISTFKRSPTIVMADASSSTSKAWPKKKAPESEQCKRLKRELDEFVAQYVMQESVKKQQDSTGKKYTGKPADILPGSSLQGKEVREIAKPQPKEKIFKEASDSSKVENPNSSAAMMKVSSKKSKEGIEERQEDAKTSHHKEDEKRNDSFITSQDESKK